MDSSYVDKKNEFIEAVLTQCNEVLDIHYPVKPILARFLWFRVQPDFFQKNTPQGCKSSREVLDSLRSLKRKLVEKIPGLYTLIHNIAARKSLSALSSLKAYDCILIYTISKKYTCYYKESGIDLGSTIVWLIPKGYSPKQLGLDHEDIAISMITDVPGEYERFGFPFSDFWRVHHQLRILLELFRPKACFTFEGDTYEGIILSYVAQSLGIKSFCFQWGIFYSDKLRFAFSGMQFDVFLCWGDYFASQLSALNPSQRFVSIGRLTSPRVSNSISSNECSRRSSKVSFIFLAQTVDGMISEKTQSAFLDLAATLAANDSVKVILRPHPSHPLKRDERLQIQDSNVIISSDSASLDMLLRRSDIAVGIWTSALVDAVYHGCIPCTFNPDEIELSAFPYHDLNGAFVYHDYGEALRGLSDLASDNIRLQTLKGQLVKASQSIFARMESTEQSSTIRRLIDSD